MSIMDLQEQQQERQMKIMKIDQILSRVKSIIDNKKSSVIKMADST